MNTIKENKEETIELFNQLRQTRQKYKKESSWINEDNYSHFGDVKTQIEEMI